MGKAIEPVQGDHSLEKGIRICRSQAYKVYKEKDRNLFITRGDSSMAEDDPVTFDQIAGKVVRVETPDGKRDTCRS